MLSRETDKPECDQSPLEIPYSGESMLPGLIEGDRLLISKEIELLDKGDILFLRDLKTKELVVHRLVKTDPQSIKGDYSLLYDHQEMKIYGKVIGLIRNEQTKTWGKTGQKYKKIIALLSSLRTKNKAIRIFSYLLIKVFIFLSSLFYLKTTSNHN